MSYLERPRLTFAGRFEADVSTVNNNPVNFDDATFLPEYDTPGAPVLDATGQQTGMMTNGWWNPTGTGIFRLIGCQVTSAQLARSDCGPDDPILKMTLENAADRPAGKLVDLDPMQQMVSMIFGLRMRLTANGEDVFTADFAAAPFADIWFTRGGGPGSLYQSVLIGAEGGGPRWSKSLAGSPFLREFRDLAGDLPLSARFLVDGFVTNSSDPLFPTGRIVGTIGVARPDEPRHFVRGRHLLVPLDLTNGSASYGNPIRRDVNNAVAMLSGPTLLLDVGNALTTNGRGGPFANNGPIKVGVVAPGGAFTEIGTLPANYSEPGWLEQTGGIVEFALGDSQTQAESSPLALSFTPAPGSPSVVCPREEPSGFHVRADSFVFRADPGDAISVDIFVSKFGQPSDAEVGVALDPPNSYLTQLQPQQPVAGAPGPPGRSAPLPGQPLSALDFPAAVNAIDGHARLTIATKDPGYPRGYIDGQVYTVRPTLNPIPPEFVNPSDTISILLFSHVDTEGPPTWWDDVQPILQRYANLYPVMRKVLDLDDYMSVIAHKDMLTYVFSLPLDDPNYMPVTRDLSRGKKRLILDWLAGAAEPALGSTPPRRSAPGSKFKVSLKVGEGSPQPALDIDGKEHARLAMQAARKMEGPA